MTQNEGSTITTEKLQPLTIPHRSSRLSWLRPFARQELSAQEKVSIISLLRSEFPEELVSNATLQRFLSAHEWNIKAASELVQKHLQWRNATLPIQRTDAIQRILDSGRIRVLRRGIDPVVCVDFMWGKFLEDGFSADDILNAHLSVLEDVLAESDAIHASLPKHEVQDKPIRLLGTASSTADQDAGEYGRYIGISSGGVPPLPYIRKLAPVLDANYPERMSTAIIYPIPRIMEGLVPGIKKFINKRDRERFEMFAHEEQLLERTGLRAEDLPEDLRGGMHAMINRYKEMKKRMKKEELPSVPGVSMDSV
jgi:hypothetical protein